MSELNALKTVLRMAEKQRLGIMSYWNSPAAAMNADLAVAQVAALIKRVEQAEKDPIEHALKYLKEKGCYAAVILSTSGVRERFEALCEKREVELFEVSDQQIMEAMELAQDLAWDGGVVERCFDEIEEEAAFLVLEREAAL